MREPVDPFTKHAQRLSSMSEEQWADLLALLERPSSVMVPSGDNDELSSAQREAKASIRFFAQLPLLYDTVEEAIEAILSAAGADDERMGTLLHQALGSRSMKLLLKSRDLTAFHERFFLSSQIVTDLRPVFGDEKSAVEAEAWLVTHQLKLRVKNGQEVEEMFVGLEGSDIDRLIQQLERARSKEAYLGQVVSNMQVGSE